MIVPLHRAPEVLSRLAGAAGVGGSVNVSIGSLAPGLLDLPNNVLGRLIGDGVASALQRRSAVRRQVRNVFVGSL